MFNEDKLTDAKTASNVNPIVLAFLGDAVYTLYVRENLVLSGDRKSGKMNELAVGKVNAVSQAKFMRSILPLLNEDELAVFKRARNVKKTSKSKNAPVVDYNISTGFEAVIGYLYLTGNTERLKFLLHKGEESES